MDERTQLEQAMAALESQRALLGDAVVEAALGPMREKLAALHPIVPAAQRKQATILFADLSGFTAMSETMDAEDVTDTMNALWQRLDQVIHQHGGMIDKHIGDAVMAIWGAQAAREDDPERAIRAALALQDELAAIRLEQHHQLQMRIGLNTGPVVIGEVGTRHEVTVMGDTVNLASRLEHAAPVGGILIAHATYRHVRGRFDVQVLEPLSLKGKTEPVQVYLVERATPRVFAVGQRGVEGIETQLVGRTADLQALQDALRAAITTQTLHTCTVLGDAGIGKSRLFDAFRSWIELIPAPLRLFLGRATPEMAQLPYALLRDLMAFHLTILDSDPIAVARAKLRQGLLAALGTGSPDADLKADLISYLLGFDLEARPALAGIRDDPRQIQQRALRALAEVFQQMAQETPLLIALEDAHWADTASLDALAFVAAACADCPILVLYLARPHVLEQWPDWGSNLPRHQARRLQPLTLDECHQVVSHILRRVPQLPDALCLTIVHAAEGNPFYIEELIKMLIEQQVIVPQPEGWQVAMDRMTTVQVPPTLTGVLQARLDSLPLAERTVLQQASVIGRTFWDQAVAYLSGSEDTVAPLLASVQQREFVYLQGTSTFAATHEYLFKHALLRDVTYESVLKRQRRVYHAAAARWLRAISGDRVVEYAGLIADHYARAGDTQSAAQWYLRAGQQAQATYANERALAFYEQARTLTPSEDHAQILFALAEVSAVMGAWDAAAAYYETALATPALDPRLQAHLQRGYGVLLYKQGRFAAAHAALAVAHATFDAVGDVYETARTKIEMASAYWRQANYAAARPLLETSLTATHVLADPALMADTVKHLGTIAYLQGEYPAAERYLEEARILAHTLGDKQRLLGALINGGGVASEQGKYDISHTHFSEGLRLAQELGDQWGIGLCMSNFGFNAHQQDRLDEAERYYIQSLEIGRQVGFSFGCAIDLTNLGRLAAQRGDYERAKRLLAEGLALNEHIGSQKFMSVAYGALGLVALAENARVEAARHYHHCLTIANAIGDKVQQLDGLIGMAAVILNDCADARRATQILAAAATGLAANMPALYPDQRDLYARTQAAAQAALDPATYAAAWTEGSQQRVVDVIQDLVNEFSSVRSDP